MSSYQLLSAFNKNTSIATQIEEHHKNNHADLILGQYQILSLLGKGSFVKVYRALNTQNQSQVALKVIDLEEL